MDAVNQDWTNLSNYCSKMENCPEGSHVMCLHHDRVSLIGPNCGNGFNVTVTPEFIEQILDVMNEMRSKIAKGEEVGQNDEPLPRGYGIIRVKWDHELANYAQLWANRCAVRHDLCRPTKRFSKPGQTVGISRFTRPHWLPVKMNAPEMGIGLNEAKVLHSMNNNMKLLYRGKRGVTKEMIHKIPELDLSRPGIVRGYLDIIRSTTTHVGCGISASTNYYGQGLEELEVLVNNLEIVCNFAGSSIPGQKVYETDPPKDEGWTKKCGCPPGYTEDDDCLCIETEIPTSAPTTPTQASMATCSADNPECAGGSSMVLLPIIAVEDVRPDKLYQQKIGKNHNKEFRNDYYSSNVSPKQRYRDQEFGLENYNISIKFQNFDTLNENKEDKNLLTLINDLQQEISNVNLNGNVKKVVDSKLRTIYENVNGDSDYLLKSQRSEFLEDVTDDVEKENKINKLTSRDRDITALNFDYGHNNMLVETPKYRLSRPINSVQMYDNLSLQEHNMKYGIFGNSLRDVHGYYSRKNKKNVKGKQINKIRDAYDLSINDERNRRFNKFNMISSYLNDEQLIERRKFYEDKLNKIKRKIHKIRG